MNEKHKFRLIVHFKDGEILSEVIEAYQDIVKMEQYLGDTFKEDVLLGISTDKDNIKYIPPSVIKYIEIKEL